MDVVRRPFKMGYFIEQVLMLRRHEPHAFAVDERRSVLLSF